MIEMSDLLQLVLDEGASDVHITVGVPPMLRINGTLTPLDTDILAPEDTERLMKSITSEGKRVEVGEKGGTDFGFSFGEQGRFRVSVLKQKGSYGIVLRTISNTLLTMEQIGLPPIIKDLLFKPRGLILVTGPTGSGKSTTLASLIDIINRERNEHIITVEDPIEFYHEHKNCVVTQREVGSDVSSFSEALRRALRQDPDVIVVGEMRDRESFESALVAADTGHLVMSTLHTANAGQSIGRILDFYPFAERDAMRGALGESLQAIVCQRLIPRATGKGVVPCNEVLINNGTIKKLILDDRIDRLAAAIEAGGEDGMFSFDQRLVQLVNEGLITEEKALEKSNNPEALTMKLKGINLNTDNAILG